jgi:hypothetical protein
VGIDHDTAMRCFVLLVAILLDPLALVLLQAAAGAPDRPDMLAAKNPHSVDGE